MNDNLEIFEDVSNPLDTVEDVFNGNDWIFNRPNPDEMTITASGKLGNYRMAFLWQEDYSAMQFFCEYDFTVPEPRMDMAVKALRVINERMWLGHFDIPEGSKIPSFRHTSLFRGFTESSGAEHVEDLVEIAMAECERYHNAFSMVASSLHMDYDVLDLVLADQAGAA